jgi:molybdopterin-binding protein
MKISARNGFDGTVKDIKKGATTAHVVIDVSGTTVTNESVDELDLEVGQKVKAIIKSSDVMVAV